jgi:nucleoside-diphosphate kinase
MSLERTFSIIKPDAVAAGQAGEILAMIQQAGFKVLALRMTRLTEKQAEGFYAVHRERPFFGGLVKFMTEGPIVVMALEREDAIKKLREVMGATNPANAAEGTVRKRFATNIERNCIHGSDAPETAETELRFFFTTADLLQPARPGAVIQHPVN